MKKILLLGATGSIGQQTIDVVKKSNNLQIEAMVIDKNIDKLQKNIREVNPKYVGIRNVKMANVFKERNKDIRVFAGEEILDLIDICDANICVAAIVGIAGLRPTIRAIENNMDIALANKETMVTAGDLVKDMVKEHGVKLIPVDSEHAAIHQCINNNSVESINRLIITASGGPFRDRAINTFNKIKLSEALKHPNWSMGAKISIDSATMMNKALEVIEAHYLFDIPYKRIDAIIHPQSIIHSMVEYKDGNILAQLGNTDMCIPINYALNYPNRNNYLNEKFNFFDKEFTFRPIDLEKFPCYKLGREAAIKGAYKNIVLNTSNEVSVELFLKEKISYIEIPLIVEKCLTKFDGKIDNVEDIIELDKQIRTYILKDRQV